MTYIDYLNHFNLWLESNPLPGNAQLLYFKLLNVFNRAGWPEQVQVDTLRLMLMAGCQKNAAYRARDQLRDAGFLSYRKGKKGAPTAYFLYGKTTETTTVSATVSGTETATVSGTRNGTHKKTKTKIKTNIPPAPGLEELGFGSELQAAFSDWLAYKQEKRQSYTPTGLKSLARQVQKHAGQYGEPAVAGLIQECMGNGWRGIIWDRLKKPASPEGGNLYDDVV